MVRSNVFLVAALLATGCQRTPAEPPHSAPAALRSGFSMADATAAGQLVHGFYAIEDNAWRWAASRFTFELGAPSDAEAPSRLLIDVSLPEAAFKSAPSVTLTCRGRTALKPETYTKAGSYTFERELEPFKGNRLRINCEVDHTLPPGPVDKRELAIIVSQVSLEPR